MGLELAATGTDRSVLDVDLRDEQRLLAVERAEYDIEGVRALLAAVNLRPVGAATAANPDAAEVMDLAIFRATGSRELARLFPPLR